MAIPDGKPATDFSAMNREWVRAMAEEAAESGGGIPAPASPSDGDVLTYRSSDNAWVAAAPSGGGDTFFVNINYNSVDDKFYFSPTIAEIASAYSNGKILVGVDPSNVKTLDVVAYYDAVDNWEFSATFTGFYFGDNNDMVLSITQYAQQANDASLIVNYGEANISLNNNNN